MMLEVNCYYTQKSLLKNGYVDLITLTNITNNLSLLKISFLILVKAISQSKINALST